MEESVTPLHDPIVKMKRGRGRPMKNEIVYRWSQIESGRPVDITGVSGQWKYVRLCDNNESATVIGGPNGHTRTFPLHRVTVHRKVEVDE